MDQKHLLWHGFCLFFADRPDTRPTLDGYRQKLRAGFRGIVHSTVDAYLLRHCMERAAKQLLDSAESVKSNVSAATSANRLITGPATGIREQLEIILWPEFRTGHPMGNQQSKHNKEQSAAIVPVRAARVKYPHSQARQGMQRSLWDNRIACFDQAIAMISALAAWRESHKSFLPKRIR